MNSSKPENVCPECKKVFSRKADCNRHVRLHYGIKPYLCEVLGCGKKFSQYTALKTHSNVHTGLKPFRCEFTGCKATFGDPSSCARHRREIHYPGKPYKCPVPGCSSSIRRSSSYKIHLKKHGLDPSTCARFPPRDYPLTEDCQSAELEGIKGGQVSVPNGSPYSQDIPSSGLSEPWDSDPFFSLPMDPSVPLMQPEPAPIVSSGSSLLFAPSPQSAPDNERFFLSPPRASPAASSRYSSPMASTPVLAPETALGFIPDFGIQLSSCLATAQDWTRNAWQDHGIQFV